MTGRTAPFLVTRFSRASFSNCLFRDISIHSHELFDVSHGGGVHLSRCRLSNVTAGADAARMTLVDTSYSDPVPVGLELGGEVDGEWGDEEQYCGGFWGHDFPPENDLELQEAPVEDADAFGAEWWVEDSMAVDEGIAEWEAQGFNESTMASICLPVDTGRRGAWLSDTDEWLVSMRRVRLPPRAV